MVVQPEPPSLAQWRIVVRRDVERRVLVELAATNFDLWRDAEGQAGLELIEQAVKYAGEVARVYAARAK